MATQILSPGHSHFTQYGSSFGDMFSQYHSMQSNPWRGSNTDGSTGYGSPHTEGFHTFSGEAQPQPMFMISPQSVSSEEHVPARTSQSPGSQLRIPQRRDRTPIRRHRPSVTRPRSHSRPEHLLAYASDQSQIQQIPQAAVSVVPSQSAPTTPQVFPMSQYVGQSSESYHESGGYFPPSTASSQNQPQMAEIGFPAGEMPYGGYYSLGRSTSTGDAGQASGFNPQDALYMQPGSGIPPVLPSVASTVQSFPPIHTPLESTPGDVEITSSRPKPQCWDHGCNGRQFSTFSNLLRHQREKSGTAMKSVCPYCGTEFTRTTARNGHMYGGKCKGRPDKEHSEGSVSSKEERV